MLYIFINLKMETKVGIETMRLAPVKWQELLTV
jgi:hypothetical protein